MSVTKCFLLHLGTPGVGKSEMCRLLAERIDLTWLEVSKLAIEHDCVEEYDEVYKCPVLDEDKVINKLISKHI